MSHRYEFASASKPVANSKAVFQGERYRLTVLTEGVLRWEWAEDGVFEDRASTFALYRDFDDIPGMTVQDTEASLVITTDLMSIYLQDSTSHAVNSAGVRGNGTMEL